MPGFLSRSFICRSSALAFGLAGSAGLAAADKRSPAPIVFGAESSNGVATSTQNTQAARPVPSTTQRIGADDRTQRITFAYPGAPVAAEAAPEQFAALPAPSFTPPTSDMFESNMSAPSGAVVTQTSPAGPIRITARSQERAAPVGRTVTMSRAQIQREASLTEESGVAGVYTDGFDGQPTANGEIFSASAMTAAHPSLPLPSLVQVINMDNGREIVVRVNDRGPFSPGRLIDLSPRAADVLGINERSQTKVTLRYLGPAPVQTRESARQAEPAAPRPVSRVTASTAPLTTLPVTAQAPAPARVAPQRAAVSAVSGVQYFIQAGSFADISNAQRLNMALSRQLPVEIEPARVNNADYFRVMVGPFASEQEAQVHRDQLDRAGIVSGFLVER